MATTSPTPQPDFITYLFSEKPPFDCHFLVGDEALVKPERVGGVKLMLMAHSVVFRSELEDSQLKEKGDIAIKDIYPDTFRTLLKIIYGHDITGDLEFDEADNLFYVAEKYMMAKLKNRLAVRLISLLTPDNVCSLLNNPAVSTHLELKNHITKILRYETDRVLESPSFLDVCTEGFISIVEQDGLAVREIELWRAAMRWAKHKTGSEDGQVLRKQLSGVTKHLRICSLTADEFCKEVGSEGVLTCDEVQKVVQSIGKRKRHEEITEISNEVEQRQRLNKRLKLARSNTPSSRDVIKIKLGDSSYPFRKLEVCIITKNNALELMPLKCLSMKHPKNDSDPITISGTVKIHVALQNDEWEEVLSESFMKDVEGGSPFEIPVAVDGCNVVLPPNSTFKIEMTVDDCVSRSHFFESILIDERSIEDTNVIVRNGSPTGFAFLSECLRYRITSYE